MDPKELRNKECIRKNQRGRLELYYGLILYYNTPHKVRFRQLRLRVVPVKFISVVMSTYHVSPLSGHIHGQRTLLRILARFWWPMVNKEIDQFIKAFSHCQLLNSCSHEAYQTLHTIY